ncbi:hypothetical protein ERJ77_21820, partial [Vibrio anguillarum]|nr:hypothetical protein [Vibrio anguillarum]
MSLLITEEFEKQNRVIKRSAFHSNYPNFVRACFACALVSNKSLSKDTLLESTQIDWMIKVASDTNVDSVTRDIVSKYLLSIRGMDSSFKVSAKIEEQHIFTCSQLARFLCELED